ncbi:MAG: DUF695 domain-containing protein [Fimbriimonadaceae bacterium]|nr:DUF695 domain-containing protein [Fimbriimonadaceae bacterium]
MTLKEARTEPLIVFSRKRDGDSYVVSSAPVTNSDRVGHPFAITFVLSYPALPNGMPNSSDLAHLGKIEDRLVSELATERSIHIGHITGAGKMIVVFYANQKIEAPVSVKTGLFKKEAFTPDCRHDPDWTYFETTFEPTISERETYLNKPLLEILAKHGDDHAKPRPVDFAARFPVEQQRSDFVALMISEGFNMGEQGTWEPVPGEFWCELRKSMTVENDAIGQVTGMLRERASSFGGEFDSWCCAVEE